MADLDDLIRRTRKAYLRKNVYERTFATVHAIVEERIFQDGLDSKGNFIGIYSPEYQQTRQRENYPQSRKVILQATGQMVNDFSFLVLPGNVYGSGFKNPKNFDKSEWVESTYDKRIFGLTPGEEKELEIILDRNMQKILDV